MPGCGDVSGVQGWVVGIGFIESGVEFGELIQGFRDDVGEMCC